MEIEKSKVLRLQTRPSGDVEVVVSKHNTCETSGQSFGPMSDSLVAVIPNNRREIVASFLLNAQTE